jgi:GrpB-like predicted nucleotidyltransferase (UPF0157 family)
METLEEKIAKVLKEDIAVVPYDPRWRELFKEEKSHLLSCFPKALVKRIEHFGSTAVPGLAAKPIVDMLVEVTSLDETRQKIPLIFKPKGYDYFWRPMWGDDTPPFYAFLIKRDADGNRTHHIHMVEAHFELWDRLFFRDYLIEHPHVAQDYATLKRKLSNTHANDRVAYTEAKTDFIVWITSIAKEYYREAQQSAAQGFGPKRGPHL